MQDFIWDFTFINIIIMLNFPKIMIVRYYELDWMEITYSNDWSEKNRRIIENRLDKEQEEDKHLESFEVFFKWENINSEEERRKWEIEWNNKNKV